MANDKTPAPESAICNQIARLLEIAGWRDAADYVRSDYITGKVSDLMPPDLSDPAVVHVNMLRGAIAKLTAEQIKHLYPDIAAAHAENQRLRRMLDLRGTGPAERYWEGRWRDEAAENERLQTIIGNLHAVEEKHRETANAQFHRVNRLQVEKGRLRGLLAEAIQWNWNDFEEAPTESSEACLPLLVDLHQRITSALAQKGGE